MNILWFIVYCIISKLFDICASAHLALFKIVYVYVCVLVFARLLERSQMNPSVSKHTHRYTYFLYLAPYFIELRFEKALTRSQKTTSQPNTRQIEKETCSEKKRNYAIKYKYYLLHMECNRKRAGWNYIYHDAEYIANVVY